MTKPPNALAFASPAGDDPADLPAGGSLTKELTRVEEANLAFYEAFSQRDIDRMAQVWSKGPHARCVHPGWELVVGWSDIRQSWQEIFRTVKAVEFQLEDVHVEVSGRSAWVNLIAYVEITTEEDDVFQAAVVTTNIFERLDGQWLLTLHHSSNFAEDDAYEEGDGDLDFEQGRSSSSGSSDPN